MPKIPFGNLLPFSPLINAFFPEAVASFEVEFGMSLTVKGACNLT